MKNPGGLLIALAPIAFAGCGAGFSSSPQTNTARITGGKWTWVAGTNSLYSAGVYGTKGVASASDVPAGRGGASSWIDRSGNLWLFGGLGLNDLWKYTPSTGEWTWVSGSNSGTTGVYGTKGVPSASNVPSAREGAGFSTDSSGNFWLFGGYGDGLYGGFVVDTVLNDLWEYNPITQEWTWVSGPNGLCNSCAAYGSLGLASATNLPSARTGANLWFDRSGNLWLFGGTDTSGEYNDLWEYAAGTGEWTWVSGSNVANAAGVYGTQGVASAGNVPSARAGATSWIDASGNLWLFGGSVGAGSLNRSLNDLWEYSPDTREWTWVSGSNVANAAGVYGIEGVASADNVPSARGSASSWIDASGNLWLFGGAGPPVTFGSPAAGYGVMTPYLNDLWVFNPNTGEWTWVSGSTRADDFVGVYGTRGVASSRNVPGARGSASSWIDASGNLWLFGGSLNGGGYNDLWKFTPAQ